MTPNQAKFQKHITEICKKLRWLFYLNEYRMDIHWCLDEKTSAPDGSDRDVCAQIWTDTTYLKMGITIHKTLMDFYDEGQYERVAEILIHEFSHTLTEPLYVLANYDSRPSAQREILEVRERQTERIKNVITSFKWSDVPFMPTPAKKKAKPRCKSRK